MKRDDVIQIVSVLANVGVLAGLIFLAIGIRQNTKAQYAETRQAVLSASREEIVLTMQDPGLVLALIGTAPLTPEESVQLDGFLSVLLRAREFAWLQYRDGAIDADQWSTEFNVMAAFFDSSRTRAWWNRVGRNLFSEDFVRFVDTRILATPATDQVLPRIANWANDQR
jgi:hypothetical protein